MPDRFGLNQGTRDTGQYAEVYVPHCGVMTQDNAPIIYIEIENGKPVLYIWADINQEDWTHRIELKDALEKNREMKTKQGEFGNAGNSNGKNL